MFQVHSSRLVPLTPSGSAAQDAVLAEEAGVFHSVLSMSMPLTTQYLASTAEKLYVEDLGSKGLWTAKESGTPVYNTEDGKEYLSGCWGLILLFFCFLFFLFQAWVRCRRM
jgi:hypothetical protein